MTKESVLFLLLATAGCASSPPPEQVADWQYRRDVARVEALEDFLQLKKECNMRGGAVLVDRNTSPRIPPSTTEMRLASCRIPH